MRAVSAIGPNAVRPLSRRLFVRARASRRTMAATHNTESPVRRGSPAFRDIGRCSEFASTGSNSDPERTES